MNAIVLEAPAGAVAEHRIVALDSITYSRSEVQAIRRKRFTRESLEKLSASIKAHAGVLQAVLLRPITAEMRDAAAEASKPYPITALYETVAGERRCEASTMAGLTEISATVRLMDDVTAAHVQLTENHDREDLHPLEAAAAYRELMEKHGLRVEDIMAQYSLSKRVVYEHLSLLKLLEQGRIAFFDGKLTYSTAMLVSTVPEDEQLKYLHDVLTMGEGGEPMTYRPAFAHLQRMYRRNLAHAKFDLTVVYQLKNISAPACVDCAKRSDANADLFGAAQGEAMCQDSACFAAKRDAWQAIEQADQQLKADQRRQEEARQAQERTAAAGVRTPSPAEEEADEEPHTPSHAAQAQTTSPSSAGAARAAPPNKKALAAQRAAEMEYEIRSRIYRATREKVKEEIEQCGGLLMKEDVFKLAAYVMWAEEDMGAGVDLVYEDRGLTERPRDGMAYVLDQLQDRGDIRGLFLLFWEMLYAARVETTPPNRKDDQLLLTADRLGVNAVAIDTAVKAEYQEQDRVAEEEAKAAAKVKKKAGNTAMADAMDKAATIERVFGNPKAGLHEVYAVLRAVPKDGKWLALYNWNLAPGGGSNAPETSKLYKSSEAAFAHLVEEMTTHIARCLPAPGTKCVWPAKSEKAMRKMVDWLTAMLMPATSTKSGEAGQPKKERAGKHEPDDRSYWTIKDLEARVPECAPDATGILATGARFRAVLGGDKGIAEVLLCKHAGKFSIGHRHTLKGGGGSAARAHINTSYETLADCLTFFAKVIGKARRASDQADLIGKLLEAGLAAKDPNYLLPKIFRNIGAGAL